MEKEQFNILINILEELRRIADNSETIAGHLDTIADNSGIIAGHLDTIAGGLTIYTNSDFPIEIETIKETINVKIEDIISVEASITNME